MGQGTNCRPFSPWERKCWWEVHSILHLSKQSLIFSSFSLRGYLTKYDCSSGMKIVFSTGQSFSQYQQLISIPLVESVRRIWRGSLPMPAIRSNYQSLQGLCISVYIIPWLFMDTNRFLDAIPTAELEPITETYVQADEVGSSYFSNRPQIPESWAGWYGHDLRWTLCIW